MEIPSESEPRPIFVVGCPRSGTTLVRNILDSHPAVSCGPESHFLRGLIRLEEKYWPRIEGFGIAREAWRARCAGFFAAFHRDYAARRGKRRWADKTPGYTPIMGKIEAYFPACQFVHVLRDGSDVVASHLARWGRLKAYEAIGKWRRYVRLARAEGAKLPAGRYHEIHYENLVARPEPELRRLLEFLGEPWDPVVLDFRLAEHDRGVRLKGGRILKGRPGPGEPAIYSDRVGAAHSELRGLLRILTSLRLRGLLAEVAAARSANDRPPLSSRED